MSSNFREFVNDLENEGELHRVTEEVDPVLEITEIAIRAQKENKPAILFDNVKGSKYPLAINTFASDKRIEIALGQNPEEIGNELLNFIDISQIKRISFRDDLNGLRAIAVLAVVFYHADVELFKGGWIGVDIFFVISGYLISNIIIS